MPYTPPTFTSPLSANAYNTAVADAVDYLRGGVAYPGSVVRADIAPQDIVLKSNWGHAWRGVSGCGEYRTAPATFHAHAWEYQPIAGYTMRLQVERSGVLEVHWQIYAEVGPDTTDSNWKPSTKAERELRVALAVGGNRVVSTTGDVTQTNQGWSATVDGAAEPYEIAGGGWIGGTYRASVSTGIVSLALVAKPQVDRVLISSGTLLSVVTYGV